METLYVTEKNGKTYLFESNENSEPFVLDDIQREGYQIVNVYKDIQRHKNYQTTLKTDKITETSYSNVRSYIFNVVTCPKYPISDYGLCDYNKERLIATKNRLLESTSKENLSFNQIVEKHLEIFNNQLVEVE